MQDMFRGAAVYDPLTAAETYENERSWFPPGPVLSGTFARRIR